MKLGRLMFAVLILLAVAFAAESKYVCKATHIGNNALAVACTNDATPSVSVMAGVLIISCAGGAQ